MRLVRIAGSGTMLYGRFGAGEGNRTLVFSLEGCCSTIELHPRAPYISNIAAALNEKSDGAVFHRL